MRNSLQRRFLSRTRCSSLRRTRSSVPGFPGRGLFVPSIDTGCGGRKPGWMHFHGFSIRNSSEDTFVVVLCCVVLRAYLCGPVVSGRFADDQTTSRRRWHGGNERMGSGRRKSPFGNPWCKNRFALRGYGAVLRHRGFEGSFRDVLPRRDKLGIFCGVRRRCT